MMLFWSAANSGPRWLTIWRAPASRTASGSEVGPGMRRFGSKRVTGFTWLRSGRRRMLGPAAETATVVYMTSYAEANDDPHRLGPPRAARPLFRPRRRDEDVRDHR